MKPYSTRQEAADTGLRKVGSYTLVMYLIYLESPYQLNKNTTGTRLTNSTKHRVDCASNMIVTLKDPQG